MGWFRKKKKNTDAEVESDVSEAELAVLAAMEAAESRDHDADFRRLQPMYAFLNRIPSVKASTGIHESDHWQIGLTIDIANPLAWNVVQELGHFFNSLSLDGGMTTTFVPISPPPYLNGGPADFLSWIIRYDGSEISPSEMAKSLEGRLPRPVDSPDTWRTEEE